MNNFCKYIPKRDFQLILLGLSLFIVLRRPIEILISTTIVEDVLKSVLSHWSIDLIFLVGTVYIFIRTYKRFRVYRASNTLALILVILTVIYTIYKVQGHPWSFLGLCIIPEIKYFDILFLVTLSQIILCIFYSAKKSLPENGQLSFIEDSPIKIIDDDELEYSFYADEVASRVLNSSFEKSFAIGVNGQWGSGKTSFLNLVKAKVKGDDIIEIDFNPWFSNSPDAIIKDFFDNLQKEVSLHHSHLSKLITKYANRLVDAHSNNLTQFFQALISSVYGSYSTNELYDDINDVLKTIKKKLVIYIDDVDRLSNEEVVEVMRLIRNTADFYNTFFIVAYDRNYVVSALKEHSEYKPEFYLEKIFQLEITLPMYDRQILNNYLSLKLKQKLAKEQYHKVDEVIEILNEEYLGDLFANIRDVIRLSNITMLNYEKVNGEVDFKDFLRLEILHYKYPSVYKLLYEKKHELFAKTRGDYEGSYVFYLINTTNNSNKTVLEEYLEDDMNDIFNSEIKRKSLVDFIKTIFMTTSRGSQVFPFPVLSVVATNKFDTYFTYRLPYNRLSYVEFDYAREKEEHEFHKNILIWINKGLTYELVKRLTEINSFIDKDDYEKIINTFFFIASSNKDFRKINFYGSRYLCVQYLKNKLHNYHKHISKKYYDNNEEQFNDFVFKIFSNAKFPFSFESDFLNEVEKTRDEYFPIDSDGRIKMQLYYLSEYCSQVDEFNAVDIFHLYHNCDRYTGVSDSDGFSKSKEAAQIIRDFIVSKAIDSFLLSLIDDKNPNGGRISVQYGYITTFFNTTHSFLTQLEKINSTKTKYREEFLKFYKKVEQSEDGINPDEFEFKVMPYKKFR